MSVRLDRVQQGLFEAMAGVAPNVVWAYQQVPREAVEGDLLSLNLLSGPTLGIRNARRGTVLQPAESVVVRVTAAAVGTRNVVKLNRFRYFTDTIGGDTLTTIRDRLLALMSPAGTPAIDPEPNLTITADGADGISIAIGASPLGSLRRLELLGELGNDAPVFPAAPNDSVLLREGTSLGVLEIQSYSKSRELADDARNLCSVALDRLQSEANVELLHRWGVVLGDKGGVLNLSAIAGGNWESRAAFTVDIRMPDVAFEPTDLIETLNYTINARDDSGNLIEQVSGSVAAP